MKRLIYSSTEGPLEPGFLFELRNRAFFLRSDSTNVTDKIARKFINAVCDYRGVGDSIRQSALYSKDTLNDFKKRIDKATLQMHDTGKIVYYTISGKGFTLNFPEEDFNQEVILL